MHDLHLADKIYQLIQDNAKKNNLQKVAKVLIELGSIEEHGATILPENLKFNLKMLDKDLFTENVDITIKSIEKGSYWQLVSIEG